MPSPTPVDRSNLTCVACGGRFSAGPRGRIPSRCVSCADTHRKTKSAERVKRWIDADPDRNRDYQRDYHTGWREIPSNREKTRAYSRKHHEKRKLDPEFRAKKREREVLRAYGLTPDQLTAMREAQGDLCAICQQTHVGVGTRLHVDHNHETGAVRALLCGKCNTLIGLANDSPARLVQAAAYLRLHGAT